MWWGPSEEHIPRTVRVAKEFRVLKIQDARTQMIDWLLGLTWNAEWWGNFIWQIWPSIRLSNNGSRVTGQDFRNSLIGGKSLGSSPTASTPPDATNGDCALAILFIDHFEVVKMVACDCNGQNFYRPNIEDNNSFYIYTMLYSLAVYYRFICYKVTNIAGQYIFMYAYVHTRMYSRVYKHTNTVIRIQRSVYTLCPLDLFWFRSFGRNSVFYWPGVCLISQFISNCSVVCSRLCVGFPIHTGFTNEAQFVV